MDPSKQIGDNFLPLAPSVQAKKENQPSINDFERMKDIGSGGYGKVYLYQHKITKEIYAIKQIDKGKFKTSVEKEMFVREVEIMYSLNHPHIVKLYSHFEDKQFCYLVMEFIQNGNLYEYVEKYPNRILDDQTTAKVIVELCSSLYYLHNMVGKPIIHRDIKPENCLIGDNGLMKLGDFGGSNYYIQSQYRYTIAGTKPYHSPEMIAKEGYDTGVDIWAIGVLIYELKCGYPPFDSNEKVLNLQIKWPKDIDPLVKDLISKILKIKPRDRLSLREIVSHEYIKKYVPNGIDMLDLANPPYILSRIPHYDDENSQKIDSLKKKYDEIKQAKDDMEKKNNKEIDMLKRNKDELEKEIERLTNENSAQQKEISRLVKEKEEEQIKMNQKMQLIEYKQKQLLEEKEEELYKMKDYESKIQTLEKEIEFYKKKVQEFVINENRHTQAMSGELNMMSQRGNSDSKNLNDNKVFAYYKNEAKKLKENINEDKRKFKELEEQIDKMEKTLKNEASVFDKKIKELEEKNEQKTKSIFKLNSTLEKVLFFVDRLKSNLVDEERIENINQMITNAQQTKNQ